MANTTTAIPQGDMGREGAQSAAEFKEKYGGKRFTSHTAPKAVLYAFLYACFIQGEGGKKEPLYPDIKKIQGKIETYEDMDAWNGYINLVEWQRSAFNTATFMRNALTSNISDLNNVVRNLIAAEELREDLKGKSLSQRATLWLASITIEEYTPQSEGEMISTLRKNIEAGLRYCIAYNRFMELIAEETKTPEYTLQKVLMEYVWASIDQLNEVLSVLREVVNRNRADEAAGIAAGTLTKWTPEFFQETMKLFEPVGENIPPVPEDNIRKARTGIKKSITAGLSSWYAVFHPYSSSYWRESVYD